MKNSQIISRWPEASVDFRPTAGARSPDAQVRRLFSHLTAPSNPPSPDDINDCDDAICYLREFQYRKIFTGTTHDEYLKLEDTDPEAIDWLIRIHEVTSETYKAESSPIRRPPIAPTKKGNS